MSYTLTPYLIDLAELRRVMGSKDEALIAAVIEGNPEAFAGGEEGVEGEISLRRALRHLVMGEPPDERSAHQYGYALEQLCMNLGEQVIGRDLWSGIRWDVIEATGADEILTRTGPPVPLPPSDDFPRIGTLAAPDIAAIVAKMGGHLTTAAPSGRKPRRSFRSWLVGMLFARLTQRGPVTDEERREYLEQYEDWLRDAAERNKSLVFFYY